MKIKVGDTVLVTTGKYKSTKDNEVKGKVLRTIPKKDRVIVENINMLTKHQKPQGPTMPGGIVKVEGPIHVSNVMYYCDSCKKGVRIGYEVKDDGSKNRICKSCNKKID